MTKVLPTRSDDKDGASAPDWEALYPADPELMTSAEGDAKGSLISSSRPAIATLAGEVVTGEESAEASGSPAGNSPPESAAPAASLVGVPLPADLTQTDPAILADSVRGSGAPSGDH